MSTRSGSSPGTLRSDIQRRSRISRSSSAMPSRVIGPESKPLATSTLCTDSIVPDVPMTTASRACACHAERSARAARTPRDAPRHSPSPATRRRSDNDRSASRNRARRWSRAADRNCRRRRTPCCRRRYRSPAGGCRSAASACDTPRKISSASSSPVSIRIGCRSNRCAGSRNASRLRASRSAAVPTIETRSSGTDRSRCAKRATQSRPRCTAAALIAPSIEPRAELNLLLQPFERDQLAAIDARNDQVKGIRSEVESRREAVHA